MLRITLIDKLDNQTVSLEPSWYQHIYDDVADYIYIEHEMLPYEVNFKKTLFTTHKAEFRYHGYDPFNLVQLNESTFKFERA